MLLPGQQAPELKLKSTAGSMIQLEDLNPENFSMLVFYRGHHCPVCKKYLKELESKIEEFNSKGVGEIYAISGDRMDVAQKSKSEWGLDKLTVLAEQSKESMREWGLYISSAIKEAEPDFFGEPGLFLLDKEAAIYYAAYNSMPFGRPSFSELSSAIDFMIENNYPPRGTGH